jgi:hypothetical protein
MVHKIMLVCWYLNLNDLYQEKKCIGSLEGLLIFMYYGKLLRYMNIKD